MPKNAPQYDGEWDRVSDWWHRRGENAARVKEATFYLCAAATTASLAGVSTVFGFALTPTIPYLIAVVLALRLVEYGLHVWGTHRWNQLSLVEAMKPKSLFETHQAFKLPIWALRSWTDIPGDFLIARKDIPRMARGIAGLLARLRP